MIEKFQSNFVFGLQGNLYQEFIDRVAKPIIQQIIGTDDYEIVPQTYHLSFKDFDKKSRVNSIFPEFYYNFLGDIVKKNNQVSFKTKVCISFDERLCNDICPNTGRKIAIIRVAGIELVYFILFNIKEFFDFVYKSNHTEEFQKNVPLTKIGYIHNINHEKNFSFIRTSINDGIPLYHDRYEILDSLVVGDFVQLNYEDKDDKFPINIYFAINQSEIEGVVKKFNGILTYPPNKDYAFINTKDKTAIYVRPKLAEIYKNYNTLEVQCLASQNEDNKWQAEILII